ncbi:MAG TPA: thioredoxin [Vicinamibacterales bacterium]|nr:thioredoxin [Vicinamibacterales bacterium]
MAPPAIDTRGLIVICSSCGAKNRLAYDHIGRSHRCAKCKTDLPHPDGPVDVGSAEQFDEVVAASSVPVLVDYWAPWCGPCRYVAPELEKVARRQSGQLLVLKVNTDAVPELQARYRIMSIPTLAVFSQGREVGRSTGARPADAIEAFVRESIQAR